MYRGGGTQQDNEEGRDSLDQDETIDNDNQSGVTTAHFDLLAESIIKLTSVRPAQDFGLKLTKQDLMESTSFVNYDRIDIVEQDEEIVNQITSNTGDEANIDDEDDTLNGQSRVRSKEQYKPTLVNILEKFEQQFDSTLTRDIYQTASNAFKIQLAEHKKSQQTLLEDKQQNDIEIQQQESINLEGESFKDQFHMKIQNIKREQQRKVQDLNSLKKIKDLELQRYKDRQQVQIEEHDSAINQHQMKLDAQNENLNALNQMLDACETDKRKEVSHYQNEI